MNLNLYVYITKKKKSLPGGLFSYPIFSAESVLGNQFRFTVSHSSHSPGFTTSSNVSALKAKYKLSEMWVE